MPVNPCGPTGLSVRSYNFDCDQRNRRITHNSIFAFSHSGFQLSQAHPPHMATTNHQNQIIKKTFSTRVTRRAVKNRLIHILAIDHPDQPGRSFERVTNLATLSFRVNQIFENLSLNEPAVTCVPGFAPRPFRTGAALFERATKLPAFSSTSTSFFHLFDGPTRTRFSRETHRSDFNRSRSKSSGPSPYIHRNERQQEVLNFLPSNQRFKNQRLRVSFPREGPRSVERNGTIVTVEGTSTQNRSFSLAGPLVSFVPGGPEESVRLDSTSGASTRFSTVFSFSP